MIPPSSSSSAELARQWARLSAARRRDAFLQADEGTQARVLPLLPPEVQAELLSGLPEPDAARGLRRLRPDDRTALLEQVPEAGRHTLLRLLGPSERALAEQLLSYPPQSVGRLMNPEVTAVRPDWTVAQTFAHLRRQADPGTIEDLYVVDDEGVLMDAVPLRAFVLSEPETAVGALVDRQYVALNAGADREDAVRVMLAADLPVLPVVSEQGRLLGEVTFDDVLDVAEEEHTEDVQRGAAVVPLGRQVRAVRLTELYRKRVGWLVVLVFVNLLSGAIIARYEGVITEVVALVMFLPLLIGSSGNAGAQAATLMVRALATGDVTPADWGSLMVREVGVSLALGLTMGVAVALLGSVRAGTQVALVVAVTMVLVVVIGSLIGLSLPFVLQRFKLDPATASGPLVTSLADVIGVVVYFAVATRLLGL